jgi:hypothetical protein
MILDMMLCGKDDMDILTQNTRVITKIILREKMRLDEEINKIKFEKSQYILPFNIKSLVKKNPNVLEKYIHLMQDLSEDIKRIEVAEEKEKVIEDVINAIKLSIVYKKEYIDELDTRMKYYLKQSEIFDNIILELSKNKTNFSLPEDINEKTYNFLWTNINSKMLLENIWIVADAFIKDNKDNNYSDDVIENMDKNTGEFILSIIESIKKNDMDQFINKIKNKSYYNDKIYIKKLLDYLCNKITLLNINDTQKNEKIELSRIKHDLLMEKIYLRKYEKYNKKN